MPPAKPAPRKGDLVSTTEACARLQVSESTLRNWVKKGLITPYIVGPRLWRFDPDDLVRMARR